MIWESGSWHYELFKIAERLAKRKSAKRWSSASHARVEFDVMTSAYIVRKLFEAQTKVPRSIANGAIAVTSHPPVKRSERRKPDLLNWDDVERWYDLGATTRTALAPKRLCDQIVHSFVFMTTVADDGRSLSGFFVSSDRQRAASLYHVDIDEFLRFLRAVALSDVERLAMRRGADAQWIVDELE